MRIGQYPGARGEAGSPPAEPVKVLAFYDEEGWAWWHRARQIQRHMPPDVRMDVRKLDQPFNHHEYDLLLLFDAQLLDLMRFVPREKLILGSSCPALTEEAIGILERERCAAGLVNSLEVFRRYRSRYPLYCCQNGVDEELFSPGAAPPEAWTACWVGNSKSIGNKGLDLIRQACESAGVDLLAWDKAALPKHEALLTQEQVRDRIYRRSTFYICASEFEGTPNPMLEAMACGLPAISTRVGNAPEIIRDGYNGFVSDRSAAALAESISRLKRCDRAALARNARVSILDGWTWRRQAAKYAAAFRELAAANRRHPRNPKTRYARVLWVDPGLPAREDAASALAAVGDLYPGAEIGVACPSEARPVYAGLPGVKVLWGFDPAKASASSEYRLAILRMWTSFEPELAINASGSPNPVADMLALGWSQAERIGSLRHIRSYPPELREKFQPLYTRLLEPGERDYGTARHGAALVEALGGRAPASAPGNDVRTWTPVPGSPRVLMVAHMFPPFWHAGVEIHTLHLAQALRAEGCDVSVLYPLPMPGQEDAFLVPGVFSGVPVHALAHGEAGTKIFNLDWPRLDAQFAAFLARERFDVVHFQHSMGLSFRFFDIARESGARTCLTLHDFWMMCQRVHFYVEKAHRICSGPDSAGKCAACVAGPAWEAESENGEIRQNLTSAFAMRGLQSRRILAELDVVTAPTRYVRGKFAEFGFADPAGIEVCALGLRPVPKRPQPVRRDGRLRFGFLGTIHPLKNVFMLTRVFRQVRGNATLAFHGMGQSEHVNRLRQEIGADGRQSYAGKYVPADLPDILAGLDAIILCSITENYPLVAREAMSAGLPVIASRVGGIPEMIEDGVNGLLFDPERPQELVACLQRLIDSPDRLDAMGKALPPVKTMQEDAREWLLRYGRRCGRPAFPNPGSGFPRAAPTPGSAQK